MNGRQRESLYRVIEAVKEQLPEEVEMLVPLLEKRRRRARQILPRKDQTQIPV
jgi:hypothetical protein